METLLPGLHWWTTFHEGIGFPVQSAYAEFARVLIDPRVPDEGFVAFAGLAAPERIVLTNRHHYRHSDRFAEHFGGLEIVCHAAGLHEFEGTDRTVAAYAWGDELAPGVIAREVGVLCPEETALELRTGPGALAFADAIARWEPRGPLAFVPDGLLGDDPPAIKAGLRAALRRLADEVEFDALLLGHGEPVARGGRAELLAFAAG